MNGERHDECLVFYIFQQQTVSESTRKILKLDWKTPGFLFFQNSGNPVAGFFCICGKISATENKIIIIYEMKLLQPFSHFTAPVCVC